MLRVCVADGSRGGMAGGPLARYREATRARCSSARLRSDRLLCRLAAEVMNHSTAILC
jgi:hypothetical protein